ncbi:MAG: shikimate kinase [Chloroflexi bacterium]|nr:shikimate kinase [Chloroflexota bacterium]MCL5075231.1 shikimate kinase [Chloroflexota bacterium]
MENTKGETASPERLVSGRKNVVITGFMGTGKTTIGLRVARQLQMHFVDMDFLIEQRSGMSIPEIFARYGEPTFREKEKQMARELAQRTDTVIATGGGTLLFQENREALSQNGIIICLTCSPEEVARRLEDMEDRPLLRGDKMARIKALLKERSPLYKQFPLQIDTTGCSIDEVATQVIRAYKEATEGETK